MCSHISSSPLRYWSLFSSFTCVTGTNDVQFQLCAHATTFVWCCLPKILHQHLALVDVCPLFVVTISLMYLMWHCVQNQFKLNLHFSSCCICVNVFARVWVCNCNLMYLFMWSGGVVSVCICFSSPSCGDGGRGGIMEWVFAPFQQSPHGLLPPLSFYSLLLGDASLSPNVTQAKTPLSSFARARYPGNTAIPPLLFCTHLLSSLILPTSNPPLSSAWAGHRICFWSMGMTVICES